MESEVLTYSFVGAWKAPMTSIPNFGKKFSMDLFGDPYNTDAAFGPHGFMIQLQTPGQPKPSVLIGPQRIQVTAESADRVSETLTKVIEETLNLTGNRQPLYIASIGLNTEHEIKGLESDTSDWLTERFLINGLKKGEMDVLLPRTLEIRFDLIENDDRKYNIRLQPRAGKPKSIFAAINDHREWNHISFPNEDEIKKLFDESVENLKTKVFSTFLG